MTFVKGDFKKRRRPLNVFWVQQYVVNVHVQHALAIGEVTHMTDETLCHYWESRWKQFSLTCADSVLLNVIQQPSENLRI